MKNVIQMIALLTVSLQMAACAVPKTVHVYDEACQTVSKHMVLDVKAVDTQNLCASRGADCLAMLVGTGVVLATTAVVSGSIVVVGNAVYWLERQGQCNKNAAPQEA